MSSWLPQNVQKRLLLYVLQQVSLFSNIDISNLDVSLGSQSQFSFNDIDLNVNGLNIPAIQVISGRIKRLNVQLTVAGNVGVSGEGLVFVLKPDELLFEEDISEQWASSLAKSVIDLTKSILDSDIISEGDSPAPTTEDARSAGGTLNSVRNKVLEMALSKLSIDVNDLEFRLLISPKLCIKVSLNQLALNSVTAKRNVELTGLIVAFCKTETGDELDPSCPANDADELDSSDSNEMMSHSVSYSKLEATSLYLSAMENIMAESIDNEAVQLATIDSARITFSGINSLDDWRIHDLVVRANEISICVEQLWSMLDCLVPILDKLQLARTLNTNRPEDSKSYKRFQQEQSLQEQDFCTAIIIGVLNIRLKKTLELCFHELSLKKSETTLSSISIFDVCLNCNSKNYLLTPDSTQPFLSMMTNEASNENKVFFNRDITLEIDNVLLHELHSLFIEYTPLVHKVQNVLRHDRREPSNRSFDVKTQSLNVILINKDTNLEFCFTPLRSRWPVELLEISELTIFLTSDGQRRSVGVLKDLVIKNKPNGCFNYRSFNSKFSEVSINTKLSVKLDSINISLSYNDLLIIYNTTLALMTSLSDRKFHRSGMNSTSVTEKALKKNMRLMRSSILHGKVTQSAFFFDLNHINVELKSFLASGFGDLIVQTQSLVCFEDESKSCAFNLMKIRVFRKNIAERTDIVFPFSEKSPQPNLVLTWPKLGNVKFSVKGCCLFLDLKWSSYLMNRSMPSQKETSTDSSHFSLDVRLMDCALSLTTHRIATGIAFCFPKANIDLNGKEILASSKITEILLIDDIKSSRKNLSHHASIVSWFEKRGYTSIIRIETFVFRFVLDVPSEIIVQAHKLEGSLCSDSLNALIQTCIDLKPAETYPDSLKYQTDPPMVQVLEDIYDQFFSAKDEIISKEENITESISVHNEPILFEENHFSPESEIYNNKTSESGSLFTIITNVKVSISEVNLKLYDGYDWKHTRKEISSVVEHMEKQLQKGQPCQDITVFDSMYIPAPKGDEEDLKSNINLRIHNEDASEGRIRLKPTKKHKIQIKCSELRFDLAGGDDVILPKSHDLVGSLSYRVLSKGRVDISDAEIIDNLPTSTWNKFLTKTKFKTDRAVVTSPILKFEFSLIRPDPHLYATELICQLNILPLTLHVDQDALDFMTSFFQFKDNRFELIDEYPDILYIQRFEINSVQILLDYKPKKVNYTELRSGKTKELMNFFILDEAKINLKHVILYGINGFSQLESLLTEIWTPDITKTQLPGILEALTPFKPLAGLSSGTRALVSVPTEHYRQNGRLGNSLQKAGMVFLRTTGGEVVKLAVKLTSGTQAVLESTEKLLGGDNEDYKKVPIKLVEGDEELQAFIDESILRSSTLFDKEENVNNARLRVVMPRDKEDRVISLYADQPKDLHSGLQDAFLSVERNLNITYGNLQQAKNDIKSANGAQEAVSTMAKAAPLALIRPLIGVTEALSKTLQGLNNQYDNELLARMDEKYKSRKKDTD